MQFKFVLFRLRSRWEQLEFFLKHFWNRTFRAGSKLFKLR